MAHAYTPGLKVLHHAKVEKNRRLPIKGEITKQVGDLLKPEDVVATTDLPGNVQMLKVANVLNIGPADVPDVMLVGEGDKVNKGQMIAETEGLFGFFKSNVKSSVKRRPVVPATCKASPTPISSGKPITRPTIAAAKPAIMITICFTSVQVTACTPPNMV